jgi:hypothetical protein
MSVPYTSTHSVSLHDNLGVKDKMKSRLVSELKHPIQLVNHRLGSDPQHWTYGGFYDLDDLRPWISNGRLDCNQFDDVEWTDVPQGWHPHSSNYALETRHMLELGSRAKVRAENQLRFQQQQTVRDATDRRINPHHYSGYHTAMAQDPSAMSDVQQLENRVSSMSLGKTGRWGDTEGGSARKRLAI